MGARNWEMKIVDVKVNDVEFVASNQFDDLVEHHKMMRELIDTPFVESQRPRAARNKPCICDRITASEQSDIVTLVNQLLGEIRNDALGTAIELWWDAFV